MVNVCFCVVEIWLGREAARVNSWQFLLAFLDYPSAWWLAGKTLWYQTCIWTYQRHSMLAFFLHSTTCKSGLSCSYFLKSTSRLHCCKYIFSNRSFSFLADVFHISVHKKMTQIAICWVKIRDFLSPRIIKLWGRYQSFAGTCCL